MGVKGLMSFLRREQGLYSEPINLTEAATNTTLSDKEPLLIFDGIALAYHILAINQIDWLHGGQYATFKACVKDYFHSLKESNIKCLVVVDGPLEEDKQITTLHRMRSDVEACQLVIDVLKGHQITFDCSTVDSASISPALQMTEAVGGILASIPTQVSKRPIYPLFTVHVFIATLHELDVEVIRSCGEADRLVSCLAKERKAFAVVSNDTDFMIFDLPGLIFLEDFQIHRDDVSKGKPIITARIYKRTLMAKKLGLPESYLSVFAALIGNDFIPSETLCHDQIFQFTPALQSRKGTRRSSQDIIRAVLRFMTAHYRGDDEELCRLLFPLRPGSSQKAIASTLKRIKNFQQKLAKVRAFYDDFQSLEHATFPEPFESLSPDHNCGKLSFATGQLVLCRTVRWRIVLEPLSADRAWVLTSGVRSRLYDYLLSLLPHKSTPAAFQEYQYSASSAELKAIHHPAPIGMDSNLSNHASALHTLFKIAGYPAASLTYTLDVSHGLNCHPHGLLWLSLAGLRELQALSSTFTWAVTLWILSTSFHNVHRDTHKMRKSHFSSLAAQKKPLTVSGEEYLSFLKQFNALQVILLHLISANEILGRTLANFDVGLLDGKECWQMYHTLTLCLGPSLDSKDIFKLFPYLDSLRETRKTSSDIMSDILLCLLQPKRVTS